MSTETEIEITASQARDMLLSVWGDCEFGIKERVKKFHSQRTIHYILSTETYSNTDQVLEIIETIKRVSAEVMAEAEAMNETIQNKLK